MTALPCCKGDTGWLVQKPWPCHCDTGVINIRPNQQLTSSNPSSSWLDPLKVVSARQLHISKEERHEQDSSFRKKKKYFPRSPPKYRRMSTYCLLILPQHSISVFIFSSKPDSLISSLDVVTRCTMLGRF